MAIEKGQSALFPIDEFNEALEKVSGLLERLDVDDHNNRQSITSRVTNLNNNFVNSVKIAAKPGLNLD
jgi:hypothetical protein